MKRLDALEAIYPQLDDCVVVTIMGAVAAELQSIGHRPNFFYLQHAMGLASSMGLGIALARPEKQVVVFDGDGSILMNLGGLTTLARYRPRKPGPRRLRQREPAVGRRLSDRDVDRQRSRRHRGSGRRAENGRRRGRSTSSPAPSTPRSRPPT